ncbi:hypothetical protein AWC38_SpisGene24036, partial [Stylophora pistillata]
MSINKLGAVVTRLNDRNRGGGLCLFTFKPDLPSEITSGTAKFADLGFVDLNGVRNKTNCLVGRGIPPAEEEGSVTVDINGKSDKTGKSSDLGQAKIYYFDERKKLLKQMVQDNKQYRAFFEEWKTDCEGHSTYSKEEVTKSPCSGSMDSGNPLYSLQGLLLLVYTAAETDARQFMALVFNSSAGRVVFNAYRCTSPLPEDVARAFGHEDTAQYLESISERLSKDLSVDEEHLQSSHILELADAVKSQSNDNHEENRFPMELEEQDQSAKTTEEENGSVFTNKVGTGSDVTPQPSEESVDFKYDFLKEEQCKLLVSSLEYSAEQLNYYRICYIVTDVLAEGLRTIFKQEWDNRYKATLGEWKDQPKNGMDFESHESPRNRSRKARLLKTMINGDRAEWDCTMLFYSILYSDSICSLHPAVRSNVDVLRNFRNEEFARMPRGHLSSRDFQIAILK